MILDIEIQKDKRGRITSLQSSYRPTIAESEAIALLYKHFEIGRQIMNKAYREFNDKSLLERLAIDQKAFNSYQEPQSDDPDFSWQSRAVRPVTRNKVISIAAHLTASLMVPKIYAQNENDEDDKLAAQVMRMLVEWIMDQSEYDKNFLYAVISTLVNPAVIVDVNYAEIYRTIKEKLANGKYTKKQVLDEVFSGFISSIVPLDEIFLGNVYEHEIQRQPFLIRRKAIDYSIAEQKYGHLKNFAYVKPGIQNKFDAQTTFFYEVYDSNLADRLVEEVIYYNHSMDLELIMVNGVLLTEPDRPLQRLDKLYPFAKTVYSLIDEGQFFFGKSLVFSLANDQEVVDRLYQMVIDGTFLKVMPPGFIYGNEIVNSSVIVPGAVTRLSGDSKYESINTGNDLVAGLNTIEKVERSIVESSQDTFQSGMASKGTATALEISRLEQNARTVLGLAGRMISFLVKDWGTLMIGLALQYLTLPELQQITGKDTTLKYKKIILRDKNIGGKLKTQRMEFDLELPEEMTDEERLNKSFDILEEEGGMDSDVEIWKINPKVFSKLKFFIKISPELDAPVSDSLKKALNLELFDRAIQLPFANQEALYRDLLLGSYDTTRDNTDKYIKQATQDMMQQAQPKTMGTAARILQSELRPETI